MATSNERPLTPAQEAFCQALATPDEQGDSRSQTDAYLASHPRCESRQQATLKSSALMQDPRVRARVSELRDAYHARLLEEVERSGIAVKALRIRRKQRDWERLQQLQDARAKGLPVLIRRIEDLENELANEEDEHKRAKIEADLKALYAHVGPGEETGLLARDVKSVRDGEKSEPVTVYRFDKAVLDALNELEESAAKELGQFVEKKDITSGGQPFKALVAVDLDRI